MSIAGLLAVVMSMIGLGMACGYAINISHVQYKHGRYISGTAFAILTVAIFVVAVILFINSGEIVRPDELPLTTEQ